MLCVPCFVHCACTSASVWVFLFASVLFLCLYVREGWVRGTTTIRCIYLVFCFGSIQLMADEERRRARRWRRSINTKQWRENEYIQEKNTSRYLMCFSTFTSSPSTILLFCRFFRLVLSYYSVVFDLFCFILFSFFYPVIFNEYFF